MGDSDPSAASNTVTPSNGPPPPPPGPPSAYLIQVQSFKDNFDVGDFTPCRIIGLTNSPIDPPVTWRMTFDGVTQQGSWPTGYFVGVNSIANFVPQHAGLLPLTGSFTYINNGNLVTVNATPVNVRVFPSSSLGLSLSIGGNVPVGTPFTATLTVVSGTSSLSRGWRIAFDDQEITGTFATYSPGTTTGPITFTPHNIGTFDINAAFWDGTINTDQVAPVTINVT